MSIKFEAPKGPPVIKAKSANELSDAYRDSLAIEYSFIGACEADTTFELGGRTFDTPVMAGPIGVREEGGSYKYGTAVNNAGAVYWIHDHDHDSLDKLMADGSAVIHVIKPLRSVADFIEIVKHDTDCGALGYAMDLSHGMTQYGEFDAQRDRLFGPKSIDDLAAINEASSLPFFIKDIMSIKDAEAVAGIGVAGIILSGHNNRFPCAVPPLMLLPEIRRTVGDKIKIFVDGGINNGYDAFKALALGADGVLSARGLMAAYVKDGPDALSMKIAEMTAELKGAMSATGSPDLAHINQDCIWEL